MTFLRNDSKRTRSLSILGIGLLSIAALSCGKASNDAAEDPGTGGGGGTPTTGAIDPENATVTLESTKLQLASDLVLLPAKDGAVKLALKGARGTSDAEARKLSLRVTNDAFEALDRVSNIMCFFSQTKFWEQANKGKYKAFIDSAKCEKEEGDDEGGGRAQELVEAFVESTREEGKPLKARVKFEMRGEDGSYETYQGAITVAAPPSDDNPAGIFVMSYNGYSDEGLTKPAGHGYIRTSKTQDGKLLLEFTTKESSNRGGESYSGQGAAAAILEKDGDDFKGVLNSDMSNTNERDGKKESFRSQYKVRFDKDNLRITGKGPMWSQGGMKIVDKAGCFDRNKFRTFIWQYDLTDAKNALVELNSGFQIEATVNGKTVNGNAGYHGIWFPPNVDVADGAKVNKVTWVKGKKSLTPYTYAEGPGRMIKFTRNQATLGQLKGTDFMLWEFNEQGGGEYIVRWNGTKFQKVAMRTQSMNGPGEEQTLATPIDLTPANFPEWGLRLRSVALDAEINLQKGVTLSDAFKIAYHSETVVTKAADFPQGNLLCFGACPKIAMTTDDLKMRSSDDDKPVPGCPPVWSKANQLKTVVIPTQPEPTECSSDSAPNLSNMESAIATFTWDANAYAIKQGATTFSLTAGSSNEGNEGGEGKKQSGGSYQSGPLFPEGEYAKLSTETKAKWPDQAAQDAAVYYKWQTGTDKWSRFSGLQDATGKFVSFDRPLDLAYTHTAASDFDGDSTNPAIGKLWRLNYGGPGQLWGMPFREFDDVGFSGSLFAIASGTKIGAYTVFPVRGEQRMRAAAAKVCAKLDVTKMPELPKLKDAKVKHTDLKGDFELRYNGGVAL
ncbi:MAG: hypothetical protein IOD12_13320 [Silvanigrellales bacterium]|nr:hypothetical protein [Silvanigrellales bacterium]